MSTFMCRLKKGASVSKDNQTVQEGDNPILEGIPLWAKVAVQLVTVVGVPSIISVALVYVLSDTIVKKVIENNQVLIKIEAEQNSHDDNVKANFNRLEGQGIRNERVLRMICAAVSKSEEAKSACWQDK